MTTTRADDAKLSLLLDIIRQPKAAVGDEEWSAALCEALAMSGLLGQFALKELHDLKEHVAALQVQLWQAALANSDALEKKAHWEAEAAAACEAAKRQRLEADWEQGLTRSELEIRGAGHRGGLGSGSPF